MNETNNFKIGLFISVGIGIFIVLLFLVGLRDYFENKFSIYTYTSESVQGLEIGSPVKYQGVGIGKVERISIIKKNRIQIEMSIQPNLIMRNLHFDSVSYKFLANNQNNQEIYKRLANNVAQGLRCKVDYTGITGMKYVELYYADNSILNDNITSKADGYIPSSRSSLAGTVGSMQAVMRKIEAIDFIGIEKDLRGALVAIKDLSKNKDLLNSLKSFNTAMIEVKKTSANVSKEVNTGGLELKKTLRAAKLLLEMLEEDPASILSGKQKQR